MKFIALVSRSGGLWLGGRKWLGSWGVRLCELRDEYEVVEFGFGGVDPGMLRVSAWRCVSLVRGLICRQLASIASSYTTLTLQVEGTVNSGAWYSEL